MTVHTAASFGTALRRLIDHLDGALERAYRDDGLDFRPRYTPVVRALVADGPQSIRALADRLGVSHSAVSQTVSQMAAAGLVAVTRGEEDARQRIVALTRTAQALLPRLQDHWRAARIATASLDTETGGVLVEVINRANEALDRRPFADRLMSLRKERAAATGNRNGAA
ncbi:MAG: MarR family winged helix-turn-helix transcriptional regulator [Sphingomonas sp.]|uniref:MarR family winged helix-turn-helix transcriptional regulator n=1 Tax=Sphingomonas sp. TaxID=28214 RepID=UPI003F8030C2